MKVHSGFAKFPDRQSLTQFARRMLKGELQSRASVSETRPVIVFEDLTDEQLKSVQSALSPSGRWFEDVQFEPFSPRA